LGGVKAYSFIVFGKNCELKDVTYNTENVCVCREDAFRKQLKQKLECSEVVYSQDAMKEIYNRLLPLANVSEEVKARHISEINKNKLASCDICPRCGGKLVIRTAKRGKNAGNHFFGCSNYPDCRFTKNIE
jgi:hypothetical protein